MVVIGGVMVLQRSVMDAFMKKADGLHEVEVDNSD